MDEAARRAEAAAAPERQVAPGWRLEVTQGPNKGAVVPLEAGEFRLGAELSNDIVLADATVANEQALLSVDGPSAILRPLAPGMSLGGKAIMAGKSIALPDGAVIHAGDTVMEVRGPPTRPPFHLWGIGGALVVLLLVAGAALVGLTSPRRSTGTPLPAPPVAVASVASAAEAAGVFEGRLREAGLADLVKLTPVAGAVVAEGSLPGPDLARWAEQQLWFDGRYKGGLSLVNRVHEATEGRPNLQLRAVSVGQVPYIITSNGDRFVEGAVMDGGWTIERIETDRVVLLRNGTRVEIRL